MSSGLSMTSVNKIKELAEAKEYSLAVEILDSQDLEKSLNPQFLRVCGEVYENVGRTKDARNMYVKAHVMGPESNRILFSIISFYLKRGYFGLAEQYAEQDKKRKEEAETINRADSLIYETEKQLRDNGAKLSDEDKNTLQSELDAFKKIRESNNVDEIKNAEESFTQKVYAIFGKIYQQEQAAQQAPGGAQTDNSMNPDGTINADGEVQ